MKQTFVFLLALSFLLGCTTIKTKPPLSYMSCKSMPIKGKLVKGCIDQLPRCIEESIDENSPYHFKYKEVKTFDESHVPEIVALYVTGVFHILGVPLGKRTCVVTTTFEIINKEKILKSYSARSTSFSYYGFYYGAQPIELEKRACHEVRLCIDEIISNNHEFLKTLKQ